MASGFDRQPTRQSFAFKPNAPVQSRPSASGASRGAEVVGGRSQGGAVFAGRQTDPGDITTGLGQFFGDMMKPYVERKQTERFFEGFTAAQEGRSLDEIGAKGGPLTQIFGPTGFQQGAEFYTAQKSVTDWQTAQVEDMDRLRTLPPAEVAKHLADTSHALMTSDPFANQLIQKSLIEASGPLVQTIAKERYKWGQLEAKRATQQAWSSSASALQALASKTADIDPDDHEATEALGMSVRNFAAGMAKPAGMAEDTYRDGLYDFMRNQMQTGNFYAVTVMKKHGLYNLFDADQVTKLEDAEHRYGQQRIGDAMSDQSVVDLQNEYEVKRIKGALSPLEARGYLTRINSRIRSLTGVDEDVYDWKGTSGEVRSILQHNLDLYQRAESRTWALEDRAQDHDWKVQDDQREKAETAAAVSAQWSGGDVSGGVAAGLPSGQFEVIARNETQGGNFNGVVKAFRTSHWVSNLVKDDLQAGVEGSVDQEYGKGAEDAYNKWSALNKANPGAAAAYYGKWHLPMQNFERLKRAGLTPALAYTRAFGDTSRYSTETIDPNDRKEAGKAITAVVSKAQPSRFNPMGTSLNPSAVGVISGLLRDRVAVGGKNTDVGMTALAGESFEAAKADGSLQIAGEFAWRAPQGSKPFHAQLGMLPDEAGAVFKTVLNKRLLSAGFHGGAETDAQYDISYIHNPQGQQIVAVRATHKDGSGGQTVLIPMKAFEDHKKAELAPMKGNGINEMRARGFDPNRPNTVPQNWRTYPVKYPQALTQK